MKDTTRIVLEYAGYRFESAALHVSNDAPRLFRRLLAIMPSGIMLYMEEWDDKAKRWKPTKESNSERA